MFDKLATVEARYEELTNSLGTGTVQNDPAEYRKQAKALSDLDSDAMQLSIPAGFTKEGQAPAGNAFTLAASEFRTNLFYNDFCHSIGVYRWQLAGTRLIFTPLSEDCAVRRAVLASQPWDVQG